ncbi:hypothetical protein [Curtobacterium sp. MCSS17_015]|uniref:hypothetical protein n=1 Tax=Curtobacterium sp. MCSS17_015 TaxID=2175666 RepID=UPI0011B44BB5|nr:hypothetical protein [Curtobacterium sp. MCSS17_015]WIB27059.1 hypothetical protein DEJ18_02900 [Curtobacterium sp. MCSS17_015]
MMVSKLILGVASVGTVLSAGVAVDAATAPGAEARACWGQITQSQGKNYTGCGVAQHFNRLSNGLVKLGNRAGANSWSRESFSWAGIAQYGMIRAA